MKKPKVAIVHDWLYGGGAELVVEQLHKMYPDAPIFTSYCSDEWRERLDNKVVTGYLQRWPFSKLRKFLPVLRQRWFKKLKLSGFDLVISSSGNGEAKFVLSQPTTNDQRPTKKPIHICYCHSPTHFYWRKYDEYLKNPGFKPQWLARIGLKLLLKPLQKRDYKAAQSVDYFIANSSHIQSDIKKYYHRDSVVIHPPVNTAMFTDTKRQKIKDGYGNQTPTFITWGRHVPYKRFDLAIAACNKLGLSLIIAGGGPETEKLKKIAGPTIQFVGRVSDNELVALAHSASAFLFPGEEDFGIAPVEAMAAGLPVIAYRSGGALDYVAEGKTGVFFEKQTVAALTARLSSFNANPYDKAGIAKTAERFAEDVFASKITTAVSQSRTED
ncbi:MAG: glycosyltransferase [Candidatus Saccharimonadales bacterium]